MAKNMAEEVQTLRLQKEGVRPGTIIQWNLSIVDTIGTTPG